MIVILSFAHIIVGLTVTLINIAITGRRANQTTSRDARRLRAAIKSELTALARLCVTNQHRLRDGKNVLSMRTSIFVYRGNIPRLQLLEETEIGAVVAAYATVDETEHLLACIMTNAGNMFYRPTQPTEATGELAQQIRLASDAIGLALSTIDTIYRDMPVSITVARFSAERSWLQRKLRDESGEESRPDSVPLASVESAHYGGSREPTSTTRSCSSHTMAIHLL